MNYFATAFTIILFLCSFGSNAQTVGLIGKSEDFILDNVNGYASVKERGIEHEEFDALVFEDKDRELSFFFTFFRGDKVCNYIMSKGPIVSLKPEIDYVKANFVKIKDNLWEKPDKTVQVQINEADGLAGMVAREIRK